MFCFLSRSSHVSPSVLVVAWTDFSGQMYLRSWNRSLMTQISPSQYTACPRKQRPQWWRKICADDLQICLLLAAFTVCTFLYYSHSMKFLEWKNGYVMGTLQIKFFDFNKSIILQRAPTKLYSSTVYGKLKSALFCSLITVGLPLVIIYVLSPNQDLTEVFLTPHPTGFRTTTTAVQPF